MRSPDNRHEEARSFRSRVARQLVWIAACAGCAGPPPAPSTSPHEPANRGSSEAPTPPAPPPTADSAPTPSASGSTAASERPAPAASPPPDTTVEVLTFTQLREAPARSLALGIDGRAAVLEAEPWLFDGKTWKELTLPKALRAPAGATESVQIFFGRDNRPRLMGSRALAGEQSFVYLRFKNGWREGHREIGSLANNPHDPLFGILGHDDPEVVCKVNDLCIIKRLTGWTILSSPAGAPLVAIAQKRAWALHPDHIAEVVGKTWQSLGALPFTQPRGLWADASGTLYVSAGAQMHHFDGKTWQSFDAPVATPRGVWGGGANDVWVTGDDGAGHFDGTRWRKVRGLSGPLAEALGRGDEVWLAGRSGVWRAAGPRR